MISFVLDYFIEEWFKNYLPTNETGKIDTSYKGNKTLWTEPYAGGVHMNFSPYSNRMLFRPSILLKIKKPKFKYKYSKYIANNGKEYLIDINARRKISFNEKLIFNIKIYYIRKNEN